MFRRNCDLRRHALTHTIGGDIPPDSTEPSENERKEKNTETEFVDDDEIDEEDDDDMELEVDSPVHSPSEAKRRSPTPSMEPNDVDAQPNEDEVSAAKKSEDDVQPSVDEQRQDEKKQIETEVPEVTHCHHDGGQTHYTMRPTQDYYAAIAAKKFDGTETIDYSQLRRHSSTFVSKMPESYMPMLHVRRDLHQKHVKSHSSFLESMPFRKRNAAGFLREPPAHDHLDSSNKQNPLNLSNRPPIATPMTGTVLLPAKSSDDGNMSQKKPSFASDPKPFGGEGNSLREHGAPIDPPAPLNLNPAPQRVPPPAHPPRRTTGFSIEDIMRR